MKLTKIDSNQARHDVSPTDAGLKVKSHVKAGAGPALVTPPKLQPPLAVVGVRPIFICG